MNKDGAVDLDEDGAVGEPDVEDPGLERDRVEVGDGGTRREGVGLGEEVLGAELRASEVLVGEKDSVAGIGGVLGFGEGEKRREKGEKNKQLWQEIWRSHEQRMEEGEGEERERERERDGEEKPCQREKQLQI